MCILGKAVAVGLSVGVGFGLVLATGWCMLGWVIDQAERAEAGELRSA